MQKNIKLTGHLNWPDNDFVSAAHSCFGFTEEGTRRHFKYRMTNRNISYFKKFIGDVNGRTILAASGSAIPLFTLLDGQNGMPECIVGFDYSPKQIAYNYLLKYAIQELSYNEFISFFGYKIKQKRSRRNKVIRRHLINKIPSELKLSVPRYHELTKRDLLLKEHSELALFFQENNYEKIKDNIERIKFLVLNLNPSIKQELSSIFGKGHFNLVYLSNVLDWVCWHNRINNHRLNAVLSNIRTVSKPGVAVIIDHLVQRPTVLTPALQKAKKQKEIEYALYTYRWKMYKILAKDLHVSLPE